MNNQDSSGLSNHRLAELGEGVLLHERAATITELAVAVMRPKSTVSHHVNVLANAGLVRVIRTRRVRAIEERYYGRTARVFCVDAGQSSKSEGLPLIF